MIITVNGFTFDGESADTVPAAIRTFNTIDPLIGHVIAPDLETVRAWALDYLNQWRGQKRIELGLTRAEFQELVYTGKALEAQRWTAAQETPFRMAAEATQRGITNLEMAQWVLSQWDALQNGSDQIEAAYVDFQQQVEAATAVEQIESILASLQ